MDSSDRKKLLDAGFRILRVYAKEKYINELGPVGSWRLVGRFGTISATEKAAAELLKDPKTIAE
jgi:hypothetical protein